LGYTNSAWSHSWWVWAHAHRLCSAI